MGESISHRQLVKELVCWISTYFLGGDDGYILIDRGDSYEKPPKIYGFIPDVCVPHAPDNSFIIGEAKTAKDLETKHTREQILAFLGKCSNLEKSIFILAVPWDMVRLAQAIVKELKMQSGAEKVKTEVPEKLSGYST